ncbi:hypothetical protein niasHT_004398 [Heterodera trifolii]|uniref:C3H1-type domain-containing protein n=1 Tax=Heterodera trifolii TaxID=157864 RepID=A0ABD2LLW9_9BILA
MDCHHSSSIQMDVFNFESFKLDDDDQTNNKLASHLYSWDPFESNPFSFDILRNKEETNLSKSFPICERIMRAESTVHKSTDTLLKMANSFSGQSIIDLFDLSRYGEPVQKMPSIKSLAERRLKFQHDLRWSFDVHENKKLSYEDRIVGRKPQTANSTPTTNSSYSFSGYATAVKKMLPTDGSADSGLNMSIEHSLPKLHQHNFKMHPLRSMKSHDDGFYELSREQAKNSPSPPTTFRGRSKSIRKRQFVNGIHLKFIKPASQCPNWDKPNHRKDEPGCTLWHPKAPCYFYPNCRLTADLCGFAHPFCAKNGCKCGSIGQSPQLNHLPRK